MQRPQISQETQWLLEEKHYGRLTPSAKRDIALLKGGEHVDYVIGFVEFLGCKIDLSKKPLIPRPETEYWVQKAIVGILCTLAKLRLNLSLAKVRVLDLFAGSGCIGVAVLKHVPQVHVDFAEKERRFCDQIKINAKLNGIDPKRYRIVRSDIFSGLKGKKYDYIFANPPYVAESKKDRVQVSVLRHEPKNALFAGRDGLDAIRPFLSRAKDFLVKGGAVYLEFDSFQKPVIERFLKKLGYQSWQFHKDQYGRWRWVKIVYNKENGSRQRTPASGTGRSGGLKRGAVALQP